MEPRTSRESYKKHEYSGPRSNRKRVRAAMKRYHGEIKSRTEVWCKKKKNKNTENIEVDQRVILGELANDSQPHWSSSNNVIKTYPANKKNYRVEAEYNKIETEVPAANKPKLCFNWPTDPTVNSHELTVEHDSVDYMASLSGNRIVDIKHVIQWAFNLERHRAQCESSTISFIEELKNGFNSIFIFKCNMCDQIFRYCNENIEKVNKSFVWGTITAGSYYTQAAHITNIMDIPTLSPSSFRKIEKSLGEVWRDHLTEEIKKNGEEEKAIAVEKNNIGSDGFPHITVYVDGGWPKRSYGHDYSSPSGMACIIGKETKKCLYIGVKNKYCYFCHCYNKQNKIVPEHTCFKNYEGPSTAMESEILVEGFQRSQEMHGLKYTNFVGDGDSSVFAQLREKVSYGSEIKKNECKNHIIKNYTGALYKILGNTKLPLYGRRLLKPKLQKLTTVARTIIMHGEKKNMREDLKNGPSHVFGCHKDCKPFYCRYCMTEESDTDTLQEMKTKAPTVWASIYAANEAVMAKSHRLSNDTTNVAENFMSVLSKFICGKRLNLYKSGSYQRRVYVAGLSHSSGQKWHLSAWKNHVKCSPGKTFKKYISQQENAKLNKKKQIRKRLFVAQTKPKPDCHYGPKAQEADEPIREEELKEACLSKLKDFEVSKEEIKNIEIVTIGQHDNDIYNTYRCDRLTASQFGMICKRKDITPCHNHVKTILYKNNIMTKDMAYGQQNESVARILFAEKLKKSVRSAGLFIDEEFCFLAASPDGVIEEENAIVEIKCFPSLARNNEDMLSAAKNRKNFPLFIDSSGSLKINKKHNYYYQIQGQLRIAQKTKCYFIGYIAPTFDLTILEIDRDENFINTMLPKLIKFYKNSVLPEIILRRVRKNKKCLAFSFL